MEAEQAPVQVGQFILAKNLGIGAFGKVRLFMHRSVNGWMMIGWESVVFDFVDTVTSHHLGLKHSATVL